MIVHAVRGEEVDSVSAVGRLLVPNSGAVWTWHSAGQEEALDLPTVVPVE